MWVIVLEQLPWSCVHVSYKLVLGYTSSLVCCAWLDKRGLLTFAVAECLGSIFLPCSERLEALM